MTINEMRIGEENRQNMERDEDEMGRYWTRGYEEEKKT